MIVIGTTLAAFAMGNEDVWGSWIRNHQAIRDSMDTDVRYFAAIEVDGRGIEPFGPLVDSLEAVEGDHYQFMLDDRRDQVTTANRLRHITFGQNLVFDYASSIPDCSHVLFLAADLAPPPDVLPKLVELDWPIVGGEVPTYCLTGSDMLVHPRTGAVFGFPVQMHMASAAMMLFTREAFRQLRWRWDADAGMSDDPCMYHDALRRFGWVTLVRKDCQGRHYPQVIPAIEARGYDLTVVRP